MPRKKYVFTAARKRALAHARNKWKKMSHKKRKAAMPNRSRRRHHRKKR